MIAIADLPETENGLVLYCLHQLNDKIDEMMTKTSKTNKLIPILFQMITIVNIQLLEDVFEMISTIVSKVKGDDRIRLCSMLFDLISENHDYTRKNKCLRWYLDLIHEYRVDDHSTMDRLQAKL
eukprot:TRINITY_DN11070_c0_g1_i1.p1 TRINITY_DN11070_c0_g1~~TRINITY_DN11070_c0_g1_i1.p1  ORF type:complete len:140 (-),score=18.19 TRINITY_DN11070_c0_g1_i1:9-380(-)